MARSQAPREGVTPESLRAFEPALTYKRSCGQKVHQ